MRTRHMPFVNDPPSQLLCPVCQCLFLRPVLIPCGHTLCESCATPGGKCPVDDTLIAGMTMQNKAIESQVQELLVRCAHGVVWRSDEVYEIDHDGCQQQIPLHRQAEHEAACDFRLVPCPSCGSEMRQRDVAAHRKTCRQHSFIMDSDDDLIDGQGSRSPATRKRHELSMCCSCSLELVKIHKDNRELKKMIEMLCERVSSLETSLRTSTERLESLLSPGSQIDGLQVSLRRRPHHCRPESWVMPFRFMCIGVMKGHQKAIRDMQVRNNTIITASEDGTVKVWDITLLIRGQVGNHAGKGSIATLTVDSQHPLVWLHASFDFSTVFTGSDNGRVKRWTVRNLTQFTLEKTTKEEEELSPGEGVTCGVVSPRYIFTGTYRKIRVLSADSLALEQELDDLHHWVRALALSPDQQLLASGAHNQVHLWNANDLRLLYTIQEDFGSVYSLCLSRTMVVVGTYNRCVQAFDLKTRELVTSLLGQVSPSHHVYLTQCERFLIVASGDGSVQIWDFVQGLLIQEMRRHEKAAYVVDMAESLIFSAGEDKEIKVFKYAKMENVR